MTMKMPINKFKAAIREGKQQIGLRSQLCSTISAEVIGTAGFDFIYIDTEHAPNEIMLTLQQLQVIAGTPTQSVVRLPSNDGVLIQRLLDVGLQNVVVPMVKSVDDAKRAVDAGRYPPLGSRGAAGLLRANRFGDYSDYLDRVHDELCLIMQIEGREGLENIGEIARVDGVDCVFFGPVDIAADFGHMGNAQHPDVVKAIGEGVKRIQDAGKIPGMSTNGATEAGYWLDKGCKFVSVGGDLTLLARASRNLARECRMVSGNKEGLK